MQKEFLQPLSGFRDYANPTKERVLKAVRETFGRYGYQPLETPSLERREVLLGKLGSESQKQLYLFEDNGGRGVGLRYDLTVSLARYVAANFGSLTWPYKRSEIGNVWRAERAQKGRLRQFTQADIDVIGVASLAAEEELLRMIADVDKALALGLTLLVNDRRLAQALLEKIKVPSDKQPAFLQIIDKAKKIDADVLGQELGKLGLSDTQLKQTRLLFLADTEADLEKLDVAEDLKKPLENLVKLAESLGLKARVDLGMVRGLEYYTGTIIEAITDDFPSSLVGGGRYDDLVKEFVGQAIPAVGVSFGVDRIVDLLDSRGSQPSAVLFFVNLPEISTELEQFAAFLRSSGKDVEVYLDANVEMGKQLKYAAKRGFAQVYLPLEAEWKRGEVVVKDLETGDQKAVSRTTLA
ncbi:MAG: histidine--tRNA ligase [Patescibacteria group bacterium]